LAKALQGTSLWWSSNIVRGSGAREKTKENRRKGKAPRPRRGGLPPLLVPVNGDPGKKKRNLDPSLAFQVFFLLDLARKNGGPMVCKKRDGLTENGK